LEAGSLRSQVAILTTDKGLLEERLETTLSRFNEAQAALNNTSRELSSLQGEVTRLRSEAARLGDAAVRGEREVGELQCALRGEREQAAALRLQLADTERGLEAATATARALEVGWSVAVLRCSLPP
jgi:predicted  nucleic acid-binding Zn-ribbon protein